MSTDGTAPVHGLRWGIKQTFVDYLRRMPDGKGAVGGGAFPVGTHEIFYELDRDGPGSDSAEITWAFRGDVRFTGHYGMLFVQLSRPWLVLDGEVATLVVEGPGGERVPLVTAVLSQVDTMGQTAIWASSEVRLTAEGASSLFNDVYAVGEPFDPLVVQVPLTS